MEGVGTVYICQSGANHVGCGTNSAINNGRPLPDIGGGGGVGGNSPGVIVDLSGAYRPPQIDKNVNSNAYGMKVYAQHVRGLDNFARRSDWGQFNSAANKIFPTDGHKVVGVMDMILNGMHGAAHGLTKLLSPFGKVLASDALMYEKPNFPSQHHGTIDNIVENIINSYPEDAARRDGILEAALNGFGLTADKLASRINTLQGKVNVIENGLAIKHYPEISQGVLNHVAHNLLNSFANDIEKRDGILESAWYGYGNTANQLINRLNTLHGKVDTLEHALVRMDFPPTSQPLLNQVSNSLLNSFTNDVEKRNGILESAWYGYGSTMNQLISRLSTLHGKVDTLEHALVRNDFPENTKPFLNHVANTLLNSFPDDAARRDGILQSTYAGFGNTASKLTSKLSTISGKVETLQHALTSTHFPAHSQPLLSHVATSVLSSFKDTEAKAAAFHHASWNSFTQATLALMDYVPDNERTKALSIAITRGKLESAQAMVNSGKIDINGRINGQANPEGTPLHKAIQANQPEMAKWLVTKGGMVVDVLHGAGTGTWKFAVDTVKGLYELGNLAGEALANSPNNLKIVTSAIEREIAEAKENPDKKLNEVSQGLANLYTKLGHLPETDKLAKSLSDWLETTPLDAQVAQLTYAGLEIATFGVGTIGKKFPRVVKEIDDVSISATGKTSLSEYAARNRVEFEKYKDNLASLMQKPHVEDSKLSNFVEDLYRSNAKVGSGSTADAVRYELKTGNSVGGKYHIQKAEQYLKDIGNWLEKNPTASAGDRAAAENIMRDLKNALDGK